MGQAYCIISASLLADLLHLPPGTLVLGSRDCPADLKVLLAHPDLPPLVEGQEPPIISPSWRRQDPVVFEGWGLPGATPPTPPEVETELRRLLGVLIQDIRPGDTTPYRTPYRRGREDARLGRIADHTRHEASWSLGDRALYLVGWLQGRLGREAR